jgi:hypothetical protein
MTLFSMSTSAAFSPTLTPAPAVPFFAVQPRSTP